MSRLTRAEVLDRLHASIDRGSPILLATAGNGLIGRAMEAAESDFVLLSGSAVARQHGLPSVGYRRGENNAVVRELVDEITNVVHETPLIAQIDAGEEPADADLGKLVDELVELGFSGIMDHPIGGGSWFSGNHTQSRESILERAKDPNASEYMRRNAEAIASLREYAEAKEREGRGYNRDIELIRAAHERDVFTIGVVWSTEQAVAIAEAGVDVIAGHCGGTAGGAAGSSRMSHEKAAEMLNEQFAAAKAVRSDILLFGHGGPFASPEDARRMYELTDAVGFLAGSAVERTFVEAAVEQAVRDYKQPVPLGAVQGS